MWWRHALSTWRGNAAELAKLRAEQQRDASASGDNAVSNETAKAGNTDIAYKEVLTTSAEVEVIVTKAVSLAVADMKTLIDGELNKQEALLSQRGRTMLRVCIASIH